MSGFWERIENSIILMRECLVALRKDPELVFFPIMSSVAALAVGGSFLWPLWDSPYSPMTLLAESDDGVSRLTRDPLAWLILFLFYFLNYFVISFFNAALLACVVVRAHGGDPGVWTGIRFALNRLPQIIGWSALAATVGVLIRVMESERKIGAKIAASVLGLGWTLATYFVVPVMVVEKVGPINAIRRSMAVMKETWGELLIAAFTMGPIKSICLLISLVPFLGSLAVQHRYATIAGLTTSTALCLATILVFATLESIFLAALYLYASDGRVVPGFYQDHLGQAFHERGADE